MSAGGRWCMGSQVILGVPGVTYLDHKFGAAPIVREISTEYDFDQQMVCVCKVPICCLKYTTDRESFIL